MEFIRPQISVTSRGDQEKCVGKIGSELSHRLNYKISPTNLPQHSLPGKEVPRVELQPRLVGEDLDPPVLGWIVHSADQPHLTVGLPDNRSQSLSLSLCLPSPTWQ